jgi:hypothetical protein
VKKELEVENEMMAHQSGRFTQNSREGVNELYYRVKAIDELPILVPIVFERFHVLLK